MDQRNTLPFYLKFSVYIIPLISLVLGIIVFKHSLPFYLKFTNPEYPYLIDGLNCALLRFKDIGYTDPGTPFQLYCGIVIRIVYMFAGKGWTITTDVLQRPEFYLSAISISLVIFQSLILALIGKNGAGYLKLPYIFILQLTPFFKGTLLNFFERCMPERFMVLVMLLFLTIWIKYSFPKRHYSSKFALWSGIIMALGLATGFHFLPVLILPLFLLSSWRDRGIYAVSGFVSFTVFVAPVLGKLFKLPRFLADGNFAVNGASFFANLKDIFFANPEIAVFLILFIAAFYIIAKGDSDRRRILLFSGFFSVLAMQVLLAAFSFNNRYMVPLFILYGIFITGSVRLTDYYKGTKKNKVILTAVLPLLLLLLASFQYIRSEKADKEYDLLLEEASAFAGKMDPNAYWYIKPDDKGNILIENALIYGTGRNSGCCSFEKEFKKINPNIITWEGDYMPEKIWHCKEVRFDSVLASGAKVYILSSSADPTDKLLKRIETLSDWTNISLFQKTVFERERQGMKIIEFSSETDTPVVEEIFHEKPRPLGKEINIDFNTKVKNWENQIRNNETWMNEIRLKAEQRKIQVDSMVHIDALYQAGKK